MYKVFFNDRKVFLTDDLCKLFCEKDGLFYTYQSFEELRTLIAFFQKTSKMEFLYLVHTNLDELQESFKKCFIPLYAAGGLVKNKNNEYLLIFRRGKWDLPKGKLNDDESDSDAALREVEEECGISGLTIVKPLLSTYHTYPYKEGTALKRTQWFEMNYSGNSTPTPQLEEDIEEVRWVLPDHIHQYLDKSYPAIEDVFTYCGK